MGPHGTWFDFIPGIKGLEAQLHVPLARTWTWQSLPGDPLRDLAHARRGARRAAHRRGRLRLRVVGAEARRRGDPAARQARHARHLRGPRRHGLRSARGRHGPEERPQVPPVPRLVLHLHPVREPDLARAGLPRPHRHAQDELRPRASSSSSRRTSSASRSTASTTSSSSRGTCRSRARSSSSCRSCSSSRSSATSSAP